MGYRPPCGRRNVLGLVKQGAGEHGECGEGAGSGGIRGDVGYHLAVDVHGHLRRRGPVLHLHRQHGGCLLYTSQAGKENKVGEPLWVDIVHFNVDTISSGEKSDDIGV